MLTSPNKKAVAVTTIHFDNDILYISLSDGREIGIPLPKVDWLAWLYKATAEQRSKWSIEPGGYAVYWEELDDGIELCHLLSQEALS